MNDLFYQYEINNMKADHLFESAFDSFVISINDLIAKKKNGLISESTDLDQVLVEEAEKFTEAISNFFQNIIENIRNLVESVQNRIRTMIQQKEVNKKLDYLKKNMVAEKIANGEKFDLVDTKKYYKAYTDYINFCVDGLKTLYSKNYDGLDEYLDAYDKFCEKAEEKASRLKLGDIEACRIEGNVSEAIEFTEKELISRASVSNMIYKNWMDSINQIYEMAKKEDDTAKINGLKRAASHISSDCSHIYKSLTNEAGIILNKLLSFCKSEDKEKN